MKHTILSVALVGMTALAPAAAHADGVTFVRGGFADGSARDAGTDEAALRAARRVFYAFELNNSGAPTQVHVRWTYDGRPLPEQTLDVGRAPRWRLFTLIPRRAVGHTLVVTVVDLAGATVHTDRLELR